MQWLRRLLSLPGGRPIGTPPTVPGKGKPALFCRECKAPLQGRPATCPACGTTLEWA